MLIDWFTVGAQTLNFLILVWLLKRFLYRPVLSAIDSREARIAAELSDADATRAEAQRERDQFRQKNEAFDRQRAALLRRAVDEAHAERQRLLDQARQAADALSDQRQTALHKELQTLSEEVIRRTRQEVFSIARKALTDLATSRLEEQMVEVFVGRLRGLDDDEKDGLKSAFRAAPVAPTVRSAFELPPPLRSAIGDVIEEVLGLEIPIRFVTAPELVSGIEFSANGQKLAWNIADYLSSVEKAAGEVLGSNTDSNHP